jgi:uncharacterized protein (DUF1015 family)
VAIIKPFRALRPNAEQAKQVSCAPYDVVYESEARSLIESNPLSFLRVTRPEAEFTEGSNPSLKEVFERARHNLQQFINDKILSVETEPCLYVYRLESATHAQTGIVACCSLDEYESGKIKKHEKTRPDKVEDRTAHMVALKAQTGLIFLAFRGTAETKRLFKVAVQSEPLYDFACSGGVRQTVWRVSQTADFVEAFAKEVPAIYIADGHHRMESAKLAREILREQNLNHTGAEEYNFVVAGIFPSDDLRIMAYNRVVTDLNNLTKDELFARIRENFTVTETSEKVPPNRGEFCMYMDKTWYKLHFAVNFIRAPDAIENLDASILQNYMLAPIFGIDDPRTNDRVGFIGGARGTAELEKLVDEGSAKLAFSLFPTTIEDLFTVSDMNEIMPPKSTWFEPKLKDGLLIHLI